MIRKTTKVLIKDWHPTPEEEIIRATDSTADWLTHLPSDILRQYRGKWIAAKDCQIVASGDTMEELYRNLGNVDQDKIVVARLEKPGQIVYR
jgi:Family of unknown function (DUF5678)